MSPDKPQTNHLRDTLIRVIGSLELERIERIAELASMQEQAGSLLTDKDATIAALQKEIDDLTASKEAVLNGGGKPKELGPGIERVKEPKKSAKLQANKP